MLQLKKESTFRTERQRRHVAGWWRMNNGYRPDRFCEFKHDHNVERSYHQLMLNYVVRTILGTRGMLDIPI
uniref:Uncharacterized protein n=1 Tax=Arundo donax TaxID=35708 RepID=A0A0A9ECM3_ARUDO